MDEFLLKEIEQCREEMIQLSMIYGLTSDVVVQSSKRLDELLNEYNKIEELTECTVG